MIRVSRLPRQTPFTAMEPARRLLASRAWAAWALPLLLGTLDLATSGERDLADSALLLAHFGLFLLWQPFFNAGARVRPPTLLSIAVGVGGAWYLGGLWFLMVWMCVLVGLLGGRISGSSERRQRIHLLLALFVLLALLLFRTVPALIPGQKVPWALSLGTDLGVPALLVLMGLLRPEQETAHAARGLDFFYSVLAFQLAIVLVLGALVATAVSHSGYFEALLFTVFAAALALLILGLVWNPSHGFSGLRTYLSRYILSVGVPFEGFLQDLAARADRVSDPRAFLDAAILLLLDLPWVSAAAWRSDELHAHQGEAFAGEPLRFQFQELELSLQTRIPQTPAVVLHVRLLAQLIAEFHAGKRREMQLRQNAYMQAVHETGARLTHDIKNLLQSLVSLSSAGQLMDEDQAPAYASMVKRQLPVLTQRLQGTLEKLRAPSSEDRVAELPAGEWWENLRLRYLPRGVRFLDFDPAAAARPVPAHLFDSVAENLLENALRKRGVEPAIDVALHWMTVAQRGGFCVRDNGSAVPQAVVVRLFLNPTSTMKGLGIGLMQAAAQARGLGYRLALQDNRDGQVCFSLLPGEPGVGSAPASQLIA